MNRDNHGTIMHSKTVSAIGLISLSFLFACVPSKPKPAADWEHNFGFPPGLSASKMDTSADPRRDFQRYAAGRWSDAAVIPGETVMISSFTVLSKSVEHRLLTILEDAAAAGSAAPKGSPGQQIGDFYASGLDEKRLTELGVAPLNAEFERINAISNRQQLSEELAHLELITNQPILFGVGVSSDLRNRKRYAIYATDGELIMGTENYLSPQMQPVRDAYRKMITDYFVLVGSSPAEAAKIAETVITIESRVAAKKLSPVEKQDPNKSFVTMSGTKLRSLLSNIDLSAYLVALNLPASGPFTVTEVKALSERNEMLSEYPLSDTKNYLRWELLRHSSSFLSPAFIEPSMAFLRARYGKLDTPLRTKMVGDLVPTMLGHPLSRLYVEKHFSPETRDAADRLVKHIKSVFRARLERNTWLSTKTRRYALEKLDKVVISTGYPDEWIDLSPVEIRRDDYLGNVFRLNEFSARRDLARWGQPVTFDGFADPSATLPVIINAAYNPERNNIEIPAAFLQAPFYDPQADAAANYCSLGAVIGHEITHGFDSQGRLYDAQGNVRSWWTQNDAKNFAAQTHKLVAQANAYEVLPGLHANGELAVGENLADVGAMTVGVIALQEYLRDHPAENRLIDGLTPVQRCFLAWAQTWADKAREPFLRQITPTDPHPPGVYRMLAPSQHVPAFFEAFGIQQGDPAWLDESKRVTLW